jgi:hypothetical protein
MTKALNLTRASNSSTRLDAIEKTNKKLIQSSHTHRASCQFNIKPESQNSSSRYQELHNLAQALMQAKKKNEKKIKLFSHIGPAASYSFKPGTVAASMLSVITQALITRRF